MMKSYLIHGILGLFLLAACGKEDELYSTGERVNWFEIKEGPGRFNEVAYEVYKEFNIPLFVNDTLGTEYRGEDGYGNPVIHVELFSPGYKIFGTLYNVGIVLSSDTNAMVMAARLLQEKVLPKLPKESNYRPCSYLLVDSLYLNDYGWRYNGKWADQMKTGVSVKCLLGVVMGGLSDMLTMTEDEKDYWAGMAISATIAPAILDNYPEELKVFYAVSNTIYGKNVYKVSFNPTSEYFNNACEGLGFLEWKRVGAHAVVSSLTVKEVVSKEMDVKDYVAAVYAYPEDKFEALYAGYPACIEKYKIIKKLIDKFASEVVKE